MSPRIAVLCAAFDAAGDAAIAGVQHRLRELGVHVPRDPAHRPHITLAAAAADPADLTDALAAIAVRHAPFALRLDHVGTFARGSTVWLGPSRSVELAALQQDAYDTLADRRPAAFADQIDPARWVPHCTLARRATRDAADRLRAGHHPLEIRVAALATIVVGERGDADYVELSG